MSNKKELSEERREEFIRLNRRQGSSLPSFVPIFNLEYALLDKDKSNIIEFFKSRNNNI